MSQIIQTKYSGPLHLVRSWMGTGERHICELVGGGYARLDGTPVQTAEELSAVIPMPQLTKALEWWAHREDEAPGESARPVMFVHGAPCYVDTGEELGSLNEVLTAFPDASPFRVAALTWWQAKAVRQHAAQQAAELALSPASGLVPDEVPVRKRPHRSPPVPVARQTAKSARRVEALYADPEGVSA